MYVYVYIYIPNFILLNYTVQGCFKHNWENVTD